jgi:hypothetical protein
MPRARASAASFMFDSRRVAGTMALGGAEVNRVVAMLEVGHDGPRRMHDSAEIRCAPLPQCRPPPEDDIFAVPNAAPKAWNGVRAVKHRRRALNQELARIVGAHALQHRRDFIERFVPADFLPARVLVDALLRVGAAQRHLQPVRIVMRHQAAHALGAQAPPAHGALGIAFDLDRGSVDTVHPHRTAAVTQRTGGRHPDVVPLFD